MQGGQRGGCGCDSGVRNDQTLDFPQKTRARISRRWRRVTAALAVPALAALATAAPAAIAGISTAPPPVTVLVHGNTGEGAFFVSPFGDTDRCGNGPEILEQNSTPLRRR